MTYRFCPSCANPLAMVASMEDGGEKQRLRCPACGWTHWNNPTPVLAAVVQYQDKILLAHNAAWTGPRRYRLITGFMEAGETPHEGVAREVKEETNLDAREINLIGVWDFQRMNQVIIAYHVRAEGEVVLSPELSEYRLFDYADIECWPAGTGYAMAEWLKAQGYQPRFADPLPPQR